MPESNEREREKNKGLASQLSPCIKTRLKFTLVFSGYVSHSPQHTPFFFSFLSFAQLPELGVLGITSVMDPEALCKLESVNQFIGLLLLCK